MGFSIINMKEQEDKAQSSINAQPDRITPRHRALMRKMAGGMTLSDACYDMGFSISRASVIVNSPLFRDELDRMTKKINDDFTQAEAEKSGDPTRLVLSEGSEKAAKTLLGALDNDNTAARVNAAKDILDRTGYAKEDKGKMNVVVEPSQSLLDVIGRIGKEKKVETDESDPD